MKAQTRRMKYRLRAVPIGAKRRETNTSTATGSRTLYIQSIDTINFGQNTNERERNKIKLQGVTIDLNIRNSTSTSPQWFRWAIIQPKVSQNFADIIENFFVGYNGERGLVFDPAARTGPQMCNNGINRSVHTVLKQGRFQIGGTVINNNQTKQEINIFKYVGLNKTLTYDSSVTNVPYKRHYFVYWWDSTFATAGTPSSATFSTNLRIMQHFHDTV